MWKEGREAANAAEPVTTADSWGRIPGKQKTWGNGMKFIPPTHLRGRFWTKGAYEGRVLGLLIVWHLGPGTHTDPEQSSRAQRRGSLPLEVS